VTFEWSPDKAAGNLRKHEVSFEEAASVFADPFASSYYDPDHSENENRYIIVGTSRLGRLLIVAYTERGENIRIISARRTTDGREGNMKKAAKNKSGDDLRPEYDLSQLKVAGRGKYAKRFQKGTNLVLLAPDVSEYFPDGKTVNSALRALISFLKVRRQATKSGA
jgi:uncharacterized DUF497 family protein